MALTQDQITAQNFKDFYGQIRPYLNGQVPTFANAFSRSDLYSTDEKIVGTFTDGKPLYQKTWTGLSVAVTASTTNWQVFSGINVPNGRLVSAIFLSNDSKISVTPQECWLRDTTGNLETCYWPEARTITDVVLRYIKTTDTPIKVGTGNDYSTDEQIIGTWLDGKPLYQKTMSGKVTVLGGWNDILHNISNIDVINVKEAFIKSGQNYWKVGGYATSNAFSLGLSDSTKIRIYVSDNETYSNADIYATINYTKTTT